MTAGAMEHLQAYHWPGNVRELENLIERACVLAPQAPIRAELIRGWLGDPPAAGVRLSEKMTLEEMEKRAICQTLNRFNGHRQRSARALGIGVRTLGMKVKRWDLDAMRRALSANVAVAVAQKPRDSSLESDGKQWRERSRPLSVSAG